MDESNAACNVNKYISNIKNYPIVNKNKNARSSII